MYIERTAQKPKIVSYDKGLNAEDISCLIIPDGCVGLPTLAALEHGIPVIAVKENKNYMRNRLEELPFQKNKLFIVENYLEAVGIMHSLKAGIDPKQFVVQFHTQQFLKKEKT